MTILLEPTDGMRRRAEAQGTVAERSGFTAALGRWAHLPGKHSQKSHAHGGKKPGTIKGNGVVVGDGHVVHVGDKVTVPVDVGGFPVVVDAKVKSIKGSGTSVGVRLRGEDTTTKVDPADVTKGWSSGLAHTREGSVAWITDNDSIVAADAAFWRETGLLTALRASRWAHLPGKHDQKSHGHGGGEWASADGRATVVGNGYGIPGKIPQADIDSIHDSAARVAAAFPNATVKLRDDMDPRHARDIADRAEAFGRESPNAAATITGVSMAPMKGGVQAQVQDGTSGDVTTSHIVLNPNYYQQWGHTGEHVLDGEGGPLGFSARQSAESGWHPPGSTTASVFEHELGHVVDRAGLSGEPPKFPSSGLGARIPGGDYSRVSGYAASRSAEPTRDWEKATSSTSADREAFAELYSVRNAPEAQAVRDAAPEAESAVEFAIAVVGAAEPATPEGTCVGYVPAETAREIEAAMDRVLRARSASAPSRRSHLPGQHDQKSHAHGGRGGSIPGGWEQVDDPRYPNLDVYEKRDPVHGNLVRVAIPKGVGDEPMRGPNIRTQPTPRRELLETVGDLRDHHPPLDKDVTVLVDSKGFGPGEPMGAGAYGYTIPRAGIVVINPNVMNPATNQFQFAQDAEAGKMSPASRDANAVQYTATHEWGHVMEPVGTTKAPVAGRVDNAVIRAERASGTSTSSEYARSDGAPEVYAEAFAQYVIGGRGSDPLADALADDQGWAAYEAALLAALRTRGRWAHLPGKHDQKSHAHGGGGRLPDNFADRPEWEHVEWGAGSVHDAAGTEGMGEFQRQRIADTMTRKGVPSREEMARAAEDLLERGYNDPAMYDKYHDWYGDKGPAIEHATVRVNERLKKDLGPDAPQITNEQMRGMVAATSPRMPWRKNIGAAEQDIHSYYTAKAGNPAFASMSPNDRAAYMTSQGLGHTVRSNQGNVGRVLESDGSSSGVHSALSGDKVRAFDADFATGGQSRTATIDGLMGQGLTGKSPSDYNRDHSLLASPSGPGTTREARAHAAEWLPSGTIYSELSAVVESVADAHNMPVGAAQAIIWGEFRGG